MQVTARQKIVDTNFVRNSLRAFQSARLGHQLRSQGSVAIRHDIVGRIDQDVDGEDVDDEDQQQQAVLIVESIEHVIQNDDADDQIGKTLRPQVQPT